jgi:uncharacterized membrane-anchored protein
MDDITKNGLSKVAAVTFGFWIIKIIATTLGEVGGDAVTMSMNLGYLTGSLIFAAIFIIAVAAQISAKQFHPYLFWFVIVATTTFGTTLADFFDRSLGIGYIGGSSSLFLLLMATLGIWYWRMGSISTHSITSPQAEMFYWLAIMFSQTLGTALGDLLSETTGYAGGVLVFAAGLAIVALLHFFTQANKVLLFWAAFILTRPLGATMGDFLDKPIAHGGLDLSRYTASAILAFAIIGLVTLIPQRAERVDQGAERVDMTANGIGY